MHPQQGESGLWEFSCLGAVALQRVRLAGHGAAQQTVPVKNPKDAALLTVLALEGPVASARVAEMLWPESTDAAARTSLRQRLFRLRRLTGGELITASPSMSLAPDLRMCPLDDPQALAQDPHAWDGEVLAAFSYADCPRFSAWLAALSRRRAAHRLDALAHMASELQGRHELARSLAYAKRLLAEDPLSERNHRRVMELHYLRHDIGAAINAFEHFEQVLLQETGCRPSAETLALLKTIESTRARPRVAPHPTPAALLRPPCMVGRDAELAALLEAHSAGLAVVVSGEAGMGKTRLLEAFGEQYNGLLQSSARPSDKGTLYAALARLMRAGLARVPLLPAGALPSLAGLLPELAGGDRGGIAAALGTRALQRAAEQLLACAQQCGVTTVIADDLHLADAGSLEMLLRLVDAEALAPLRWVFAHRPTAEADEEGKLLAALGERPASRWIELRGLDSQALTDLLDSLGEPALASEPGSGAALKQHTGGNPFFVLETLRALDTRGTTWPEALQGLPPSDAVRRTLDHRLKTLSAPAQALARIAAVAVPDFSLALAEAVLEQPALSLASAWQELEQAGVLQGTAFVHDLVHDAMLRATPSVVEVHLHRCVAAHLARHEAEPAKVAAHWQAGGCPAEAAAEYLDAAALAQAATRPREQALYLRLAADCHRSAGDTCAAWLALSETVPCLIHSTGLTQAGALSEELVLAGGESSVGGRLWAVRANTLLFLGQGEASERAARNALAKLPTEPSAWRRSATRSLAMARCFQGDLVGSLALLQPLLSCLEEVQDLRERIETAASGCILHVKSDRASEAIGLARQQFGWALQLDDRNEALNATLSLVFLLVQQGDLVQAVASGRAGLALAEGYDEVIEHTLPVRMLLGSALCGLGHWAEGLSLVRSAHARLTLSSPNTNYSALAEELLAEALMLLGRFRQAGQLISSFAPGAGQDSPARRLLLRARMPGLNPQDRDTLLQEAMQAAQQSTRSFWRVASGLALAAHQPPAQMLDQSRVLYDRAQTIEALALSAAALTLWALALARLGEAEAAAARAAIAEQGLLRYRATTLDRAEWLNRCAQAWQLAGRPIDAARCNQHLKAWTAQTTAAALALSSD